MRSIDRKKDVCVVIPMHNRILNDLEESSFKRIVEKFSSRKIFTIYPRHLEEYTLELISKYPNTEGIVFDDKYYGSVAKHNRLMLSCEFYRTFEAYKYLLMCHVDVMVFKDDLNYWVNRGFDFVGAPVFEGYSKDKTYKVKSKGANSGFSLLNIQSCIKVLSSNDFFFSKISSLWNMEKLWYWKLFRLCRDGLIYNYNVFNRWPRLNDDMYWSIIVPEKYNWFKVCPPIASFNFAFEVHPKASYELNNCKVPMAIHAWWRYDKEFVLKLVEEFENQPSSNSNKIAIPISIPLAISVD